MELEAKKKKKKNGEQSHSHLYSSKETWSFQGSFLHLPEQFETTGLAVEGVKVRSRACPTGWRCQRAENSEKPRALGPGATWEQTACVQRSFQTTPLSVHPHEAAKTRLTRPCGAQKTLRLRQRWPLTPQALRKTGLRLPGRAASKKRAQEFGVHLQLETRWGWGGSLQRGMDG